MLLVVLLDKRFLVRGQQSGGLLATIQRENAIEQVLAKWVMGCDGLHSTSRTLTGIDMIGHDII